MIEELKDFFQLYIDISGSFMSSSLEISMLGIYTNVILYLFDFYQMVKRKSREETTALLLVPFLVSVVGAFLAAILLRVPKAGELGAFLKVLSDDKLSILLLMIPALYGAFWLTTYISRKKQGRKETCRWLCACIPDYFFCAGIVVGSLGRVVFGRSFLAAYGQRILWLYLYCIYFLCCKIILLILLNLIRLYTLRLPFRWREGKNPVSFVKRYFLFYQNAMARSALLFGTMVSACVGVPLALEEEEAPWWGILILLFLCGCLWGIFMFATRSVRAGLRKFSEWGNRDRVMELFCREYFAQEPLYHNSCFTVTRHFLVAEQYPALVYFWGNLSGISGRIVDKDGESRQLSFTDGQVCRMTLEEAEENKKVFAYAEATLERKADLTADVLWTDREVGRSGSKHGKRTQPLHVEWVVKGIVCAMVIMGAIAYGMYRQSDVYAYKQYLQRANEDYVRGQYQSSMDNYKEALALKPDSETAKEGYFDAGLALARENLSQGDDSTTLYQWLIKTHPEESELYVEAAQLFLMREEYLQALAILQEGYRETKDVRLVEKEAYVKENIKVRSMKKMSFGTPTVTVFYTYDPNGNVLTEEYYKLGNNDQEELDERFTYTYNDDQQTVRTESHFTSYESTETEYWYDEAGRETVRLNRDLEDETWSCRYTTYDEQGRVCKIEYSHGQGDTLKDFRSGERRLEEIHVYEEQEDGGYLEMDQRYDSGALWMLWINRYDVSGNCTESDEYLQSAEKSLLLPEDVALWRISAEEAESLSAADWMERWKALDLEAEDCVTVCVNHTNWKYDVHGNMILEEREGMSKTMEYDEEQRVVVETKHYSDRNGHSNTFFTYTHEYNELGQRMKTSTKIVTQDTGYRYTNYEYTYVYAGQALWVYDQKH